MSCASEQNVVNMVLTRGVVGSRLHIIGVKEPIVFKTTIAYDIRRIFQDYRAPQRHLVVSERSTEDDRVMPFRMDSERSVDDSVGLPTPSSSPPAVPPKPAALQPPAAGTNAQPTLPPFSMKSRSTDTVESTPTSESPVLVPAMPSFPTLSIPNTSEVDSEDSFVQDGKQSDSGRVRCCSANALKFCFPGFSTMPT